ncbi:hypothetical protein [Denitratisoma oestradiolicum]|uniref:GspL periplasmic domain-containing protein n=1 Tax=Denitratisoma oestradiolicum TaxID=311182 RepID=A0A6S6XYD1_9PROT|nr:hypothetical protein [Denitratisoma oestradiolicum]TWO79095.1 hypothetical protein CBW56_16615 [Denitratisoma oestradiolicum]CAB1369913.1 conserved protein of unknown function [Denitratisoma oestradiolicum]
MACCHLLHLDSGGMRAYRWRDGTLVMEQVFAADDSTAFEAYLRRHAGSVFRLLADLPEEAFRIDHIPPVRGRDRKALINRRLSQHFHDTPLVTGVSLGRGEAGRRDETILCAAFTHPEDFEPWRTLMGAAETRLAGIHSAALLTGTLPDILSPAPVLLLTLSRGGLRQSFFTDGQFRFSRLTPSSTGTGGELARVCVREAGRIHEYLRGQDLLDWQTPLQVLILAHPDQMEDVRRHCQDSEQLHFGLVNLQDRAREAGLKTKLEDSGSEGLFLHWLASRSDVPQFAPRAERRFFRLHQWRLGLRAAGAMLSAAALIFSLVQALEIRDLREQTARLRTREQSARQTHEAMFKTLPPLPIGADRLKVLIARHDSLVSHSPSPRDLHVRLGQALEQLPQVELQRIDWFLADTLEQAGDHPQSAGPGPGNAFVIDRVDIRLAGDPQARRQTLDTLKTHLARDGALDVHIQPPHPAPSGVLTGSANVELPPLVVRIARRLP